MTLGQVARIGLLGLATLLAGCSTHSHRLRDARELFYTGDPRTAVERLERERKLHPRDRDCVALDMAVASLFSGDAGAAEQLLLDVRDRFDHLEQKLVTESALAMLTDDNARAYAGEDYEKIMIRAMLALSSLVQDGGDALAYCHQLNQKQDELISQGGDYGEKNPKLAYGRVAIGAYLHGTLREASHVDYDDAERSFVNVASWEPDFPGSPTDLQRVRCGRHSAPGNGVVCILAFTGRGPSKVATTEHPTSEALFVADRILSMVGKHTLPPTIAPIKVPRIAVHPNPVAAVAIAADGQPCGQTCTITDVTRLAVQQHEAIFTHLVARAVVRRCVKKAAVYAVKDELNANPLVGLGFDAVGVAWEAAESADTRGWGLLPDKIQVQRLELPVGEHALALQPISSSGRVTSRHETAVQVENGRTTFVLAYFPDERLAGQILTSTPY